MEQIAGVNKHRPFYQVTAESLERAEVDAETYAAVGEALISARYQAAGELYLQLVRLRTDLARRAGYDNYAEYAYEALYTRDYSLEDAAALREAAKRCILPLQLRLLEGQPDAVPQSPVILHDQDALHGAAASFTRRESPPKPDRGCAW